MRRRHLTALVLTGALSGVLLGACSSDSSSPPTGSADTTATTVNETTTSIPLPETTTEKPNGCTAGATPPPAGAVTKEVVDVDGDGRRDEAWMASGDNATVTVGINTAAGGGATTRFNSASPVRRSMLVADANDKAPTEIFLDDGRSVQLYVFNNCGIEPMTDPGGGTYTFSLGFSGFGTGVGCIATPEGQRLVGLNVVSRDNATGTVEWSRTIVELEGTSAHNGTTESGTFHSPADDAAIQSLNSVTCGDLTIDADGLTLPQ